ncbi:erythromycin esterase family protein [Steroidobacter sp.]|uniref:erythromycin esterase family protein n=1 Tax=Steroidobacter sp. TaxID=1978227 RepID=UPI001A577427|nr:erythromycin esterase family protein [Steroidobacter sp.]MBL8268158.1 erythromycin esterase family protein [Steroidobacter sp.]
MVRLLVIASLLLSWQQVLATDSAEQRAATAWAAAHAVALPADVGAWTNKDLGALDGIVGNARVVGFGEGAHGAHEFLIARNRIFQYLVEQHGFTAMVAETHPVHAQPSDAYAQGQAPLSDDAVEGVFAANRTFSWSNRPLLENYELLEWMRQYNATRDQAQRIHFYGMDLRHPYPGAKVEPDSGDLAATMGGNVLKVLKDAGPKARVLVFVHNGHLRADLAAADAKHLTLGQYLRRALGDDLRVIGSIHHRGQLNDGGNLTVTLPAVQAGSLNQVLAAVGQPSYTLDLRSNPSSVPGRQWFDRPQQLRGSHWQGTSYYSEVTPSAGYDAFVVFAQMSPIRPYR